MKIVFPGDTAIEALVKAQNEKIGEVEVEVAIGDVEIDYIEGKRNIVAGVEAPLLQVETRNIEF
jgi:hypothetical protein